MRFDALLSSCNSWLAPAALVEFCLPRRSWHRTTISSGNTVDSSGPFRLRLMRWLQQLRHLRSATRFKSRLPSIDGLQLCRFFLSRSSLPPRLSPVHISPCFSSCEPSFARARAGRTMCLRRRQRRTCFCSVSMHLEGAESSPSAAFCLQRCHGAGAPSSPFDSRVVAALSTA